MKSTLSFALAMLFLLPSTGLAQAPPALPAERSPLWIEGSPALSDRDLINSPYADLAEAISPAVVNVLVSYDEESQRPRRTRMPGPDSIAQGSGFIINADGHIVTNFHVIDQAAQIRVRMSSEEEYEATVVGVDPDTDLALLKIDTSTRLPTVPLGESRRMRPGDYVIAIGSPLGLSHSVTAGIISAVGRRDLPIEGHTHQGQFIQTDAPINPGNSGGPLINMYGEVIGVNTAVNRHGQGISFAIPIDTVKTLLPQLKERGYVERSWLGVRIQPLDLALARSFSLDRPRGALVTEVLPDSPASRAGLLERDVILSLNTSPIDRSETLPWIVSTTPGGTEVTLEVFRDGQSMNVLVQLDAIPNQDPPTLPGGRRPAAVSDGSHGVEVTELTTRLARQLSTPEEQGVVVTSLRDGSPARIAGLRNRDVIVEIGPHSVDSVEQFYSVIDDVAAGEVVRFKVLRRGRTIYMAFTK